MYTVGKEVLSHEPFGGLVSATVMSTRDSADRKLAEALGLELAPVSLQQVIVHLTSGNYARKAAEVQ